MNPLEPHETKTITAIDSSVCEKAYIESGCDPKHLSSFLKKYPAGFYLSWVKAEILKWYGHADYENLKLLQPGRGERKEDTGLQKVFIDFLIYKAVIAIQQKNPGLPLTRDKGVFDKAAELKYLNKNFSFEQIRDRYYRFLKYEPAIFIDGNRLVFGPGRVNADGVDLVGFLVLTQNKGFQKK